MELDKRYHKIPLKRNTVGQFILAIKFGTRAFNVILDTGASSTVLDLESVRDSGIPLKKVEMTGGGVGTAEAPIFVMPNEDISINGLQIRVSSIYAMDLGHVNASLIQRASDKVQGVMGCDILTANEAIIDCKNNALYLLSPYQNFSTV